MNRQNDQKPNKEFAETVKLTVKYWYDQSRITLTEAQAREAIEDVSGMFDLLYSWREREKSQLGISSKEQIAKADNG